MNILNPDKEYNENRDDLYIKKIPRKKKIIIKKNDVPRDIFKLFLIVETCKKIYTCFQI